MWMQNTRFPNLQKKKKRMGDVVYSHTNVWLSCGIGCEPQTCWRETRNYVETIPFVGEELCAKAHPKLASCGTNGGSCFWRLQYPQITIPLASSHAGWLVGWLVVFSVTSF